jgi:hypothetical protein
VLAIHALAVSVIDSGLAVWAGKHQPFSDLFPIQFFAARHFAESADWAMAGRSEYRAEEMAPREPGVNSTRPGRWAPA